MNNLLESLKGLPLIIAVISFMAKGFEYLLKTDIEKKVESRTSKLVRKASIEIFVLLSVIALTMRLPEVVPTFINNIWVNIGVVILYLVCILLLMLNGVGELRDSLRRDVILRTQRMAELNENKVITTIIILAYFTFQRVHNYMLLSSNKMLEVEYSTYSELIKKVLETKNDTDIIAVLMVSFFILGIQYSLFRYLILPVKGKIISKLIGNENQVVSITLKDGTVLKPYNYISQNATQYVLRSIDNLESILLEKSEVRQIKYSNYRNVSEQD